MRALILLLFFLTVPVLADSRNNIAREFLACRKLKEEYTISTLFGYDGRFEMCMRSVFRKGGEFDVYLTSDDVKGAVLLTYVSNGLQFRSEEIKRLTKRISPKWEKVPDTEWLVSEDGHYRYIVIQLAIKSVLTFFPISDEGLIKAIWIAEMEFFTDAFAEISYPKDN